MSTGNGSNARVIPSRPAISVGGQDRPALSAGLLSLTVLESTGGLYRCEAEFGNWGAVNGSVGFLHFDRALLDFGADLVIRLAAGEQPGAIFEGRVTGIEARFPRGQPPTLTVLAEDRLQDLRMTRRTRTFEDVDDRAAFEQIATEHGLQAEIDIDGPRHRVLAQVNQSDLAFVRERARALDAEVWVAGRTFYARSHARRMAAPERFTWGGNLHEFTVLADLAHQRTSVTVNGWDVAGKEGLHSEAADDALGGELNGDLSGAAVLRSAFGERKEALAHTVPVSQQEAQAVAEAYFKAAARRFVTGRGVAEASTRLHAGATIDLHGLGPLFSGRYYVTEVAHLFDGRRGLCSEFTAERPGLGRM
jgi:phage protein D